MLAGLEASIRRVEPIPLIFANGWWQRLRPVAFRVTEPRRSLASASARRSGGSIGCALRHDRITAPWLLEGPIDGDSFATYVEKVLLPTLRHGDIVIMDNLGSHRGKIVRQLIRPTHWPSF